MGHCDLRRKHYIGHSVAHPRAPLSVNLRHRSQGQRFALFLCDRGGAETELTGQFKEYVRALNFNYQGRCF
ncbi:hypothetical protein TRIHO_19180 [Tritonibacter horizontis]|uniref:Uncharacterized protein n=1 Tax=Tritonibacter horizontis TaxID=1768241 RepID=A0A132BXT6_9RHOB|nr:hypothetical protein TRIHO_19180 [Tritonibacter horizontis]